MKLLHCPYQGLRPLHEFAYGGELRLAPDPEAHDHSTWASYVWNRSGTPGLKREWWFHTPSATWFITERDTENDQILRTFVIGEEVHS